MYIPPTLIFNIFDLKRLRRIIVLYYHKKKFFLINFLKLYKCTYYFIYFICNRTRISKMFVLKANIPTNRDA